MSAPAATLIVLALFALHQDVWFWNDAAPLVLGVLPIGLFYHVVYTLVTAATMAVLVKARWPEHLDLPSPESTETRRDAQK
jgi:hypothetical protein